MLYILHGEDDFSLHQALDTIKGNLGDREMVETNTTNLEVQHLTLAELRTKCDALPFLSPHRLVMVNGLLGRFEQKEGKPRSRRRKSGDGAGEWAELASYVKKMPATTVLVLIDAEVTAQNPLLQQLLPLAQVRAFALLKGNSLRAWIQQRVKGQGGSIKPTAVQLLADLIGGDLWAMDGEIQKLLLYSQGHPIEEEDVRKLVSHAQEVSIFALVDAVAEHRNEQAQLVLHRLLRDGMEPTHIMTMITRQYRLIAQAREMEPGLSRPQMQGKLGLKSPYALEKTLGQARSYDFAGVKRAYDKLLETDLAIKTGRYGDKLALELLVTELASPSVSS
jgi:DNA polymerase III subunit delta